MHFAYLLGQSCFPTKVAQLLVRSGREKPRMRGQTLGERGVRSGAAKRAHESESEVCAPRLGNLFVCARVAFEQQQLRWRRRRCHWRQLRAARQHTAHKPQAAVAARAAPVAERAPPSLAELSTNARRVCCAQGQRRRHFASPP